MLLEQQLLVGICVDRHDLAARLAFADLLEEGGQPDRAELIRVQIALDRLPHDDPRHAPLRRRERQLLTQYGAAWAALGPGIFSYEFRRGFVELVWLTAGNFLRHAGRLFRRAPLHRVRLTCV